MFILEVFYIRLFSEILRCNDLEGLLSFHGCEVLTFSDCVVARWTTKTQTKEGGYRVTRTHINQMVGESHADLTVKLRKEFKKYYRISRLFIYIVGLTVMFIGLVQIFEGNIDTSMLIILLPFLVLGLIAFFIDLFNTINAKKILYSDSAITRDIFGNKLLSLFHDVLKDKDSTE